MIRIIFVVLFFTGIAATAQDDCQQMLKSDGYFSALATAQTEKEARAEATSLLITTIISMVSSTTETITTEVNNTLQSYFYNRNKSLSQLQLHGLKYINCTKAKREYGATVVAYISKEDLKKSSDQIKSQVNQYFDLMENKKLIGADYLADAYTAYLYTFLTPYPIEVQSGNNKIVNARTYLESTLSKYLSQITVFCESVQESEQYPDEQLKLNLKLNGSYSNQLKFILESDEFNARCELIAGSGSIELLMQPASVRENIKANLIVKPVAVPAHLKDIDHQITIMKKIEFVADMSPVIKIDFSLTDNGSDYICLPYFRHISVRDVHWITNGKQISSEQKLVLPKSLTGNEITLKINNSDELKVTKTIVSKKTDSAKETQLALPDIAKELKELNDFPQLYSYINKLKEEGKVMLGRKTDFLNPANCWIFLIEENSQRIMYALGPDRNGRMDIRSNKLYLDFEKELKGLRAIWVEFY